MNAKLVRATSIGLSVAFLISFLAIFVPSAAAQSGAVVVIVDMKSPTNLGEDNRLDPESELGEIPVTVTLKFPPTPGGCTSQWFAKIEQAGKPGYASAVVSPPQQSGNIGSTAGPVYGAQQAEASVTLPPIKMIISVTRDAPAFKDEEYKLKVTVTLPQNTNGCSITSGEGTGAITVKNDYLPLTNVVPAQYFQKAGQNKKVIFPIDVFNIGNGPSRVKVDIIPLGKNRLDSVIPPAELRLESRSVKGASALFKSATKIEAQTPHSNGYTNSIYSFQTKFTTAYDGPGENTAQDETTVTLSVQVQGVYVPGFDSVSMVVALGIALLGFGAYRRRK